MNNAKIFFIVFIFFSCIGRGKEQSTESDSAERSPFSPVMGNAIKEFISYNSEIGFTDPKVFNITPFLDQETDSLYLYFNMSRTYDKDKIVYYYTNDDYLCVYNASDTIRINGLIDFSKMKVFKDSIIGYEYDKKDRNVRYDDMTYRIIKVNSPDSLVVLETGI